MRYFLAIGGLLVGAAAIFGIWFFVPKGSPAVPPPEAARTPPEATVAPVADAEPETDEGSLRICNQTFNPVSIALGYRAERGWQSEGWWVAPPGECKTVYNGTLDARYYYVFAADDIGGGSWDGDVYMCTRDETFTIFGVEDCLARGYERTGFFEVDTKNRSNWMLQLTEGEVLGAEPVAGVGDEAPLEGELNPGAGDTPPATEENPVGEGATSQ